MHAGVGESASEVLSRLERLLCKDDRGRGCISASLACTSHCSECCGSEDDDGHVAEKGGVLSSISRWGTFTLSHGLLLSISETACAAIRRKACCQHISKLPHQEFLVSTSQRLDHAIRRETLSHIDTICQFDEDQHDETGSLLAVYRAFGVFYSETLNCNKRRACTTMHWLDMRRHGDLTTHLLLTPSTTSCYQGCLADAERLYNRAVAGYEKALGPDYTSALTTVNNLGLLYRNQGRLADAERMYPIIWAWSENLE